MYVGVNYVTRAVFRHNFWFSTPLP